MVVVDAYGEEILCFKVLVAKYNLEDSRIRGEVELGRSCGGDILLVLKRGLD
jgi:hypothetical protein